jgi:hypothetical protein
MSVQAKLLELGYAIEIRGVGKTWAGISAALGDGKRERKGRTGYKVDLVSIGSVHVTCYHQHLQFKFKPAHTDATSTPWESVVAIMEAMNDRLRGVLGVRLDPALKLQYAVIDYVFTFDSETVPQSLQQWMRYLESICADVVCDHGCRCITVPAPSRTVQGRVSTLELRADPQRSERSGTLIVRMSVYRDLLETVNNKTGKAKWTVHDIDTQHQLLLERKLQPLLDAMQHFRPARCLLAPAELRPAAARAFHAWLGGRDVKYSKAVTDALADIGINVSVPADAEDRRRWATPVLSPSILRGACTRGLLLLAKAKPKRVHEVGADLKPVERRLVASDSRPRRM